MHISHHKAFHLPLLFIKWHQRQIKLLWRVRFAHLRKLHTEINIRYLCTLLMNSELIFSFLLHSHLQTNYSKTFQRGNVDFLETPESITTMLVPGRIFKSDLPITLYSETYDFDSQNFILNSNQVFS